MTRFSRFSSLLRLKAKHCFILLSAALIYIAFLIAGIRSEAKGKERQAEAEAMFAVVQPFPNAALIQHSAHHKMSSGVVSNSYQTAARFADIRSYYDTELANHGWAFLSEKPLLEWGKESGRRAAYYKKDRYRASLYSGGDCFSLYFSW